jgi:CBS domain-containing protein
MDSMNVDKILEQKGGQVVSVTADATLIDAIKTLTRRKIGVVVVTEGEDRLSGIISERDIIRALSEAGADALTAPVSRYMTRKVVTCALSDTVAGLMSSMTTGRFRHLPVIEQGRLAGLVSIGDVVKARIAEAESEAQAMRDYIATG